VRSRFYFSRGADTLGKEFGFELEDEADLG
jgi:hypothetical protein